MPECVREIKAHAEPITGVQFSPGDGSVIASGSYDGLTRLWDTASGSCLVTIYAEQAGLPAKQAPCLWTALHPRTALIYCQHT